MRRSVLIMPLAMLSCMIDMRQVPGPRSDAAPIWADDRVLYVGSFDLYASDRAYVADAWRASLMSVIRSHRIFENVQPLPAEKNMLAPGYLILDAELRPTLDDSYNWWVTWPAIYPLTVYWPVQIRTGKYKIEVTYRIVDQEGRQILSGIVKQESEATVYFYGFFRTGSIERMIETTNLEAMESCAKKIESDIVSPLH